MKRHLHGNKHDSFVDEVDLVRATPKYALVRFPSGRETTVSLRDVAPSASATSRAVDLMLTQSPTDAGMPGTETANESDDQGRNGAQSPIGADKIPPPTPLKNSESSPQQSVIPRSNRVRKPVDRYGSVVYY